MHCIVHIDGGSRGNPGPAGAGVVIADADDGAPLHEAGYFLGRTTNNVAEYEGLVRALELADAMGAQQLTLRSDSQLLVRQLHGEYRVKSSELRPLFERAQSLLRRFDRWSVAHVKRELNARADALANRAMDAQANVIETDGQPFTAAAAAAPARKPAPARESAPATWTLALVQAGEGCPAAQPLNEAFTFGPTTPAGCCVHAADAAFAAGWLQWDREQREEVRCARCRGRLSLERR